MGSYITLGNAFAFFGFLIGAVIVPIIITIIAKKNSNYVNSLNISFGEIEKKLKDIEEFKKEIKADIKIDINRIYDQIEEIRKGIYKKIEESNKQIIEEFKEFCALNQRGCNKSIETKIDNTNNRVDNNCKKIEGIKKEYNEKWRDQEIFNREILEKVK